MGENATHVEHLHKILQESWFSFLPWKEKTVSISPFNKSCVGVFTKQDYSIRLDLRREFARASTSFQANLINFTYFCFIRTQLQPPSDIYCRIDSIPHCPVFVRSSHFPLHCWRWCRCSWFDPHCCLLNQQALPQGI